MPPEGGTGRSSNGLNVLTRNITHQRDAGSTTVQAPPVEFDTASPRGRHESHMAATATAIGRIL
jgi:hypothetical protein